MDITVFKEFSQKCSEELPKEIDFCKPSDEKWIFAETLLSVLEKNIKEIPEEIFEKNGFRREDILFFATMGDGDYIEEMLFAETLLSVLEKNIKEIPEEIFEKNGFRREDILFFATMGDGDYIEEMLEASIKMFNSTKTLKAYGLAE